ncbi:MAG: ABC transporter substrate-binding protein [Oscillospiraceae bacterium]
MKKAVSLLLSVLMLMGFTACSTKPKEPTPTPSAASNTEAELQDFVFGVYNFSKVDPADAYSGWSTIRYGVGETLFVLDENLATIPCLASNYSLSDDKLTWTLTLRDGVKFHNGKVMDGSAVKANLERLIGLNDRAAANLNISSIKADGNSISITTAEPNPTLLNALCDPYACIIDVSADVDNSMYPVGTGPYMMKEYVEDVSAYLEPFTSYWRGTPAAKSITVKAISDVDTLAMAMQNGEIDAAYGVSYDTLDIFANDPAFEVTQAATARVYMLYFNLQHEYLNDANFRKAICMAVDKDTYGAVLINGAGTPTKAAFPSSLSYGDDSKMTEVPSFDPVGAKALLEANSYSDTDGDGFIDKDGKKVSLRLVTYGRAGLPQSSQALQSALQDLGIEVSFEQFDSVETVCSAGDFDICAYACVTTPTGDPYSYLNSIAGVNGNANYGKYDNAKVQELLAQLAVEFDTDKRAEIATEIQQLITGDSSYNFMFHLNMFMVTKVGVRGITQSPVDYYQINVNTARG